MRTEKVGLCAGRAGHYDVGFNVKWWVKESQSIKDSVRWIIMSNGSYVWLLNSRSGPKPWRRVGNPHARENRRVSGKIAFAGGFSGKITFFQIASSASTPRGAWKCNRARYERSPGNGPTVIDSCLAVTFEKVKWWYRERGKRKLSDLTNFTTCQLLAWPACLPFWTSPLFTVITLR